MSRVWAMPPGADFARLLVEGLRRRMADQPPEAMARVILIVNTARMARRVKQLFVDQGAGFLPRIRLVTDLAQDAFPGLPPAVPALRRRLELSQLVAKLVESQDHLAPRSSVYDLSDSLAVLMDEMHGEAVHPAAIAGLDVSSHSDHWKRTQAFMQIVARYFGPEEAPDSSARQRRVIEQLVARWQAKPPDHPVILAGSTGSRGATALLMQAVAKLPQGMLVLPGFDFELPPAVWAAMGDAMTSEDHPQYRFHRLLSALGMAAGDVPRWGDAEAPAPGRNALISLSLRPAPVTDQWRVEGPHLPELGQAMRDVTLVEAPSPRLEALAIALILRGAAERGERAALVTPDRQLSRQVTAALDRWGILPDDSAGRPLALSPPGRFLRHVAGLFGQKLTGEALLVLLKHPLCASGAERGSHLRFTRELELWLRRKGAPFPDRAVLERWASQVDGAADWAGWLIKTLERVEEADILPLTAHVARHQALAERLAGGPGRLWEGKAGEKAAALFAELTAEAGHGGALSPADYRHMFDSLLNGAEVQEDLPVHPGVMIWGTLEARVQGADLVVLGGLNEGVWPQVPPPDPWMNRKMRKDVGLLLPDRKIGLSAHDYQQAVAAKTVVLSRAARDAEAETVPSRWVNRLMNLMSGLPERGGPAALSDMRRRGAAWVEMALALEKSDRPAAKVPRPAPCPPVAARPKQLSVTEIATLVRDPYAIYAKHVLGLRMLNPLRPAPDAGLRGQIIHRVLETFARGRPEGEGRGAAQTRLAEITGQILAEEVPWAMARHLWQARLERAADFFLTLDQAHGGVPVLLEEGGQSPLTGLDMVLKGRPDRIDRLPDGQVHLFDYKTGQIPSAKQQRLFDKQLPLLAAMVERGAFGALGRAKVQGASYVGLGANPEVRSLAMTEDMLGQVWDDLHRLIGAYQEPDQGFAARRAMEKEGDVTDYDHLSRYGEWETSQPAQRLKVGE